MSSRKVRNSQPSITKFFSPSAKRKLADLNDHKSTTTTEKSSDSGLGYESTEETFTLLQLVLAKFSNYPWWPAMICKDQSKNKFKEKNKIHVQFFDKENSRAWVSTNGITNLTQASLDSIKLKGKWANDLKYAKKEASKALKLSPMSRHKLVSQQSFIENEEEEDSDQVEQDEEDETTDEAFTEEEYEEPVRSPKRKRARKSNTPNEEDVNSSDEKENISFSELNTSDQEQDDELTEYERIRLKNIEMRNKLFQELNLDQSKSKLNVSATQIKEKTGPSKRGLAAVEKAAKAKQEPQIIRKSLRLQGIDADTGHRLPEKEPTSYQIPVVDEHPRQPLKTLDLQESLAPNFNVDDAKEFLNNTFKETREIPPADSIPSFGKNIPDALSKLSINEDRVAKVVPDRIFSLAIHPTENKRLIAAGGKWGGVGIWDIEAKDSKSDGVYLFMPHSRPINCLSFDNFNPNRLISTSYDGTLRALDLEKQVVELVYGNENDDTVYTTYHKQIDEHCFIFSLGSRGQVAIVDTRISNTTPAESYNLFEKRAVKTVDVHPTKKHLILSPNNRGECAIFDIRNDISKKAGRTLMSPILEFEGHTKAISSAFFSRETGKSVCTVSYDDKIRLYCSWSAKEKAIHPYKSIYHNNQTGRWLTTFKAEWHPKRDDLFFIGCMKQPRQINVFSDQGVEYPSLQGESLGSICSIVKCHPSLDMVVGGNSSGRVHVFM